MGAELMNDFTKDELLHLRHTLHFANIHDWEIGKKIQSMIDNYCEHHESDRYDYFKIAENEMLMDVLKKRKPDLKCKKCGALYTV